MRSALTLGEVSASFYCGISSKASDHLKSHISNQVSLYRGLCDGLQDELYSHCRFYPRNLGKYSYLFQAHHSQRLGIQDFENPFAWQELDRPSNSGVTHLWRELNLPVHLQRTWRLLRGLVGVLCVYLSEPMKSLVSFLVGKEYPLKLACPYVMLKSWFLLLVAKLGYQSYSFRLNQVVCPYLILPQMGIGCKP